MDIGTVAAGRIGLAVLRRLKPFDVKLHYTNRHRLPKNIEEELNLTYHPDIDSLVKVCDVVTINAPLYHETENLFNDELISKMKRGAYLVNTAAERYVIGMPLCVHWKADDLQATREMCGFHNRLLKTIHGERCHIMA